MTASPDSRDANRHGAPLDRGRDGRSTGIPSGLGTPDWLTGVLRHCTRCGGPLAFGPVPGEDRRRHACAACGHIAYANPRLVVTTIPVTDDGRLILLRRAIEPAIGSWTQPGGFLEVDETVAEGAARETFEEVGLVVEIGEIVGLYSRLEAAVVVVTFEATIVGGELAAGPEALAVGTFLPEEIPWPEIALRTTHWSLHDWVHRHRPDLRPPVMRG